MSSEKKDKFVHKIDKMVDFLEEFKECLEDSEVSDDYGYRGSYRKDSDEDDMHMDGRYGYKRGYRRGM